MPGIPHPLHGQRVPTPCSVLLGAFAILPISRFLETPRAAYVSADRSPNLHAPKGVVCNDAWVNASFEPEW